MSQDDRNTIGESGVIDPAEIHNEDFQFVLRALLDAYQPILEEDLARARKPEQLKKEAESKPPSCEDEIALAGRIFEKFFSEEVAVRMLPPEGRTLLGPIDRWRWCLLHIRCCIIFGWLVCRGPRTFRAFAYYLYRYWLCVRQALGTPVGSPPTEDQRNDFRMLVQALADAYKPYLTDQLAAVEIPLVIPDEVLGGKIDCLEGQDDAAAVFDRLLTVESAPALLGKAAFDVHQREPFFWFCRCWCLCAIRFGCCLARARNFVEVLRCLVSFFRCLRDCFRPLFCELSGPRGCVADEANVQLKAMVVPITGWAGGLGFSHYVLEWSTDNVTFHATNFIYPPIPPGNPVQGNSPVFGGLLAYLNTTTLNAGTYFIRLTVFGAAGATQVCAESFALFKKDVVIRGVDSYFTLDTSPYDPAARFIETVPALCARPAATYEMSFRNCLSIEGGAFVGGCDGRRVKRYSLAYKHGFETNPTAPGFIPLPPPFNDIEYDTPAKQRAINDRLGTSVLTSYWGPDCLVPVPFPPFCLLTDPQALLYPSAWYTHQLGTCDLSGLVTLRLTVEDTLGNLYYDTQRVWIDNKPLSAKILIDAVARCADLFVSQFAKPPDCSVPWNVPLRGIAFDELIDELAPANRPNDNFDYYTLSGEKQGGPSIQIPVSGPDPQGNCCFFGIGRVGDPGTRCGVHVGPEVLGTLAQFDLRAVDKNCKGKVACITVPDDFTIPRGECCVYIFHLYVQDRSVSPCEPNYTTADWPVKICNDLP
jgi:hypothetical protein